MSPQRGYESVPIENAEQIWFIVTCVLAVVFPTCFVVLRFVARPRLSNAPLDASDYCIATALLFVIALCIVDFFMILRGGFTFDLEEVHARFGPGALDIFFKCMAAWPLLWNACVLTSKLSVLAMYQTVISIQPMFLAVRIVGVFVILYNVSGFIAGLTICRPYAKNYDWQRKIDGSCGNIKVYYEWLSALNVVSDVIILLLPLPFLYRLRLATRKKIVLFAMFSIGFVTCGVTIFRQTLLPRLDANNPTGTGMLAFLFSTVEIGVAVSLACVPFLRPLFRDTFGSSNGSGRSTSNKDSYQRVRPRGDDASDLYLDPLNESTRDNAIRVETTWRVQTS